MASRPFFLKRQWIGAGQMVTGAFMSGYCFIEILRYPRHGALPPLFGETPMAYSTAVLIFASGLAWFWNGLDKRMNGYQAETTPMLFSSSDIAHILAATISAIGAAIVGWMTITR